MNPDCVDDVRKPSNGHQFEADEPVCPKCTADARQAETAGVVVELVLHHFDPPHPKWPRLRRLNAFACDHERRNGMMTGVASVVNCPECKKTEAYKAAAKLEGISAPGLAIDPFLESAFNSAKAAAGIAPEPPAEPAGENPWQ